MTPENFLTAAGICFGIALVAGVTYAFLAAKQFDNLAEIASTVATVAVALGCVSLFLIPATYLAKVMTYDPPEDSFVWETSETIELQALSTATDTAGGGGLLYARIDENDVFSYLVRDPETGGVSMHEMSVDGIEIFEIGPEDENRKPRIETQDCRIDDGQEETRPYSSCGERTRVFLPEGSISAGFDVSPRS